MLFKKEKKVVGLILKHIDLVDESLKNCMKAVEFYIEGDIDEAKVWARKTRGSESEADVIRYDIRDKLYSGAYLPVLREDIYKLVESYDKVGNAAEACSIFFLNQRPSIPDDMKSKFLEVFKESFGVIDALKSAGLCYFSGDCDEKTVREFTKEVSLQESRVDKLEWDLTKEIFVSSLDFAQKMHLKMCLDHIGEISDRAEDAGDQLELVTLKSVV